MADTNAHHDPLAGLPVEGDGISYQGIWWFAVILALTTITCGVIVWGLFRFMEYRVAESDPARSPVARPAGEAPPGPRLLTDEPANLRTFRQSEDERLASYEWLDKNAGTVRIPIDRAKDLVLERGFPVR
jgi:hypothetical protein